jgi:hypothetical protein
MIHPTIRRVVIVQRGGPEAQPDGWPALVAKVHDDRLINAAGFTEEGTHFSRQSIQLLQDDDAPPESGPYAEWMPYQKGQAAKAEQLQAQLGAATGLVVDNAESSGPVSA